VETSSVKVYLTFPKELVQQPLIYWVGKKFDVVTNIRGASISGEIGLVALEINGPRDEVEKAIDWLKNQGVQVEPIEKNVIE
jgi:ABC-type methionine transport system ATPase subunit